MKSVMMILCLFIVTASFSQKQTIQLNLSVGKTYSHLLHTKTILVQTINGKDSPTSVETTAKTNYFVKSLHDSVYEMMVSYERLTTKNNTGQGEMEFSSDSSKQDITSKIFQAFVHKPFLVVMTKKGRILEMHVDSILSASVNQIAGLTEQERALLTENLKKILGGNASKGNFEMLTAIYTSMPVGIGSSWFTSTKLQSLTRMDLNGKYTLKAIKPYSFLLHGEIEMISAKQDSAIIVNDIPLYYDLSGKMTADFELDKTTGWISSGTVNQSIKGTIKFKDSPQVPGGMDVPASIATEMSIGDKPQSQFSMTAEKVIRRYIEVSGGEKFLNSLKATKAIAKGVFNGDSVVVTMLKVVPFKMYMKFETSHHGIIESIYNNGQLILKKDGQVIHIADSSGLEDLQVQSFLLADMAYQKLGYSMNLFPSEEDSTYKVQLISPKGRTTIKYFSKKTGYLTKAVFEGATSYFSDYQNTGGFMVNRKEITINQQGNPEEIRLTKFILNPKYDVSIFDF